MTPSISIARRPSNTPMSPKRWNSAHVHRSGLGPAGAAREDGTNVVVTANPSCSARLPVYTPAGFPESRRGERHVEVTARRSFSSRLQRVAPQDLEVVGALERGG